MNKQMELAELARDDGMKRAVDHADRVEPDWSEAALQCIRDYPVHTPFLVEDVRQWAHHKRNLPHPPDARAWGAVIKRAQAKEIIRCTGYTRAKNKSTHAGPRSQWIKL